MVDSDDNIDKGDTQEDRNAVIPGPTNETDRRAQTNNVSETKISNKIPTKSIGKKYKLRTKTNAKKPPPICEVTKPKRNKKEKINRFPPPSSSSSSSRNKRL